MTSSALTIFPGRQTVPLESALKRQFYPALVLLDCLLPAYQYKTRREVERSSTAGDSPKEHFLDFVNKLAFLACADSGGNAVSATAILQNPDASIQYVFAFNSRSAPKLLQSKQQMESIIGQFRQDNFPEERKRAILRTVVSYNTNRVKCYLRALKDHLHGCIKSCEKDTTDISSSLGSCLRELYEATQAALTKARTVTDSDSDDKDQRSDIYSNKDGRDDNHDGENAKEEVDVPATERLIWMVYYTYKSKVFRSVYDKIQSEETQESSICWNELVHAAGRLITYKQAIDVCVTVRGERPELFDNFDVLTLPSSSGLTQPLNFSVMTAQTIIRKTVADDAIIQQLTEPLEALQASWGLDRRINEGWTEKAKLKPVVHAEMQILHWLKNTDRGTSTARFFLSIKYIGTSKPPCKLCTYYFEACRTDVKIRSTHGNTYMNWRTPDIYIDQGHAAVKERKRIIQEIKYRIRYDIEKLLEEKQKDGGPHDSSTYASRPGGRGSASVDNISTRMGALSIVAEENEDVGKHYAGRIEAPISRSVSPTGAEAGSGSEDDDGGGTLLYQGRAKARLKSART